MSTTNKPASLIYDEFMKVVATGDEAAAKQFLTDHINEFPEAEQKKIVSAFFFDALEKKADEIGKRAAVQKEAMTVLSDIEKAKRALGDEKKKADIKAKLGM